MDDSKSHRAPHKSPTTVAQHAGTDAAARPAAPASPPHDPLKAVLPPAVPPRTRFQFAFPDAVERGFSRVDDALIDLCQRRTAGLVYAFSLSLTFFTSIEVSLLAPPTLFALGYDSAAGLCASVLFTLGIVSQIPKKFIFRPRPWMVNRAVPVRRDKTSSFPSRAVVCAVVFSWLVAWSLKLEGALWPNLSPLKLWLLILLISALTAFARINVGAHYPSDTLLGFVLGCVVVKLGGKVEQGWRMFCDHDPSDSPPLKLLTNWAQAASGTAYKPLTAATLISYAMTLISIQGFWVKCSYVYGLLLSSAAFRATYVCPSNTAGKGAVAAVLDHGPLSEHVRAAGTFALLLFFGMLTRGRKGLFRVFSFTLIYFGTLLALVAWRLRTDGGDGGE